MEDKLKLEFVVNQIQDNGNTSASLVSVEHKPDQKITVSWTTKSKSIFLYRVAKSQRKAKAPSARQRPQNKGGKRREMRRERKRGK